MEVLLKKRSQSSSDLFEEVLDDGSGEGSGVGIETHAVSPDSACVPSGQT